MKTGVIKGLSCSVAAFALTASGSIFVPTATYASSVGGVMGRDGNNVTVEMYVEVGDQRPVEWTGVTTPENTNRVDKEISSEYATIVGYDTNEGADCMVRGDKVGFGVVTCRYLDEGDGLLQTVVVNTHVFADPNADPNPDTNEYLDVAMVTGATLKLSDAVGSYFDNPSSIRPEVCPDYDEEEGPAFTISGNSVADAVITAGNEVTSGSVCFHNAYSSENDEMAQLSIQIFEQPKLDDLTLVAYGKDKDKSTTFAIEDEGNLPFYTISSSDEGVVSVAEDSEDEYVLTAQGVGEAVITVTYDTFGHLSQTFKVTVNETAESGVYTALTYDVLEESALGDVSSFMAAKRADGDAILGYYDVELEVKDSQTGDVVDLIEEAGSARKVTLPYPDGMPGLADGYTRVYYVIRDHNGVKEILPAYDNGDGENFYFYSDKFSTFALAYYDIETVVAETVTSEGATLASATTSITNPKTLDDGVKYIVMAGAAAVVMVGTIVYLMRREA